MIQEYPIKRDDRIMRMSEVVKTVGLSKPQIYVLISRNEFPKQFKLTSGGKAAGWLQSEVIQYIESRIIESRKNAA